MKSSAINCSKVRITSYKWCDRNGAENTEAELVPKRQTPPIFYNVKTLESVTKKIIAVVMLVGFLKFQLDREALDFSYRLKQISRKLVVF